MSAYRVTPSTGTVHHVTCPMGLRSSGGLPWPEFADRDDDKACRMCLPDGLPAKDGGR